jgi:hypothetical protein
MKSNIHKKIYNKYILPFKLISKSYNDIDSDMPVE